MIGPKEWGPRREPREAELEFAGLRFKIRRLDAPGRSSREEYYSVLVRAPYGSPYPHMASVNAEYKWRGMGLLMAALDAAVDIRNVKEDFDCRRYHRFLTEEEAGKLTGPFDSDILDDVANLITEELRKNPVVVRHLLRGFEDLMRRRGNL